MFAKKGANIIDSLTGVLTHLSSCYDPDIPPRRHRYIWSQFRSRVCSVLTATLMLIESLVETLGTYQLEMLQPSCGHKLSGINNRFLNYYTLCTIVDQ